MYTNGVERTTMESKPEETEPAKSDSDAAAEETLASLTDLIIATLKEPLPSRFQEAIRLCEVAQTLIKSRAKRADDFRKLAPVDQQGELVTERQAMLAAAARMQQIVAVNNTAVTANGIITATTAGTGTNIVGYNLVGDVNAQYVDMPVTPGGPIRRPQQLEGRVLFDEQGRLVDEGGALWTGPLDTNSLMRHMLMAFGPHAQTGAEANRARVASEEAQELDSLAGLIAGGVTDPEKSVIEKRIAQLMSNMERRSNANRPAAAEEAKEELRVVPPDDSRGHPPGEDGPEGNEAPSVRADAGGGSGDGEPPPQGALNQVGEIAVV